MTPRATLKLVADEPTLDITAALRAEIMRRDWSAAHVAAERSAPVFLPGAKGGWRR